VKWKHRQQSGVPAAGRRPSSSDPRKAGKQEQGLSELCSGRPSDGLESMNVKALQQADPWLGVLFCLLFVVGNAVFERPAPDHSAAPRGFLLVKLAE
jgi:hypothetical protein